MSYNIDGYNWGRNSKMSKTGLMLGIPQNHVISFDLPAGFTCPAARACAVYTNRKTGKMRRGRDNEFTCYAARLENQYPATRRAHWRNFDKVMSFSSLKYRGYELSQSLQHALPSNNEVTRIHSSGDFFAPWYFEAWLDVTLSRPDISFFAYTKRLFPFDYDRPDNFGLVYSHGGKNDEEAAARGLPTCYVAMTQEEAATAPRFSDIWVSCIDAYGADDFYSVMNGESFVLLLH